MAAETNTEKTNTKAKKKWWIPLLIVYLVFLHLVLLALLGTNVYFVIDRLQAKAEAEANAVDSYNYTIADELIGAKSSEIERWVQEYYDGSYTIVKIPSQDPYMLARESWEIVFDETQKPIEIEGCTLPVDAITIDISGTDNVRNVGFKANYEDVDEYTEFRKAFVKAFGDPDMSEYSSDETSLYDFCMWNRMDERNALLIARLVSTSDTHMSFNICGDVY